MTKRRVAVLLIAEDGGYRVHVPDLPGAITFGDTEQEALAMAREAIELLLETEAEQGLEPSIVTTAKAILVREVEAQVPSKKQRKLV